MIEDSNKDPAPIVLKVLLVNVVMPSKIYGSFLDARDVMALRRRQFPPHNDRRSPCCSFQFSNLLRLFQLRSTLN